MKKNKKIYIITGIILGLIVLVSATSYALFRLNVTENTNFKVKIGSLELTIDDTQTGDNIILDYLLPTEDGIALEKDGYTFNLQNKGTIASRYYVYLDDLIVEKPIEKLDNSYMRLNIWDSETEVNTTQDYSYYKNNNLPIASGILQPNEDIDYELKLWLKYEADNDAQNKYFAAKVRVEAHQINEIIQNSGE